MIQHSQQQQQPVQVAALLPTESLVGGETTIEKEWKHRRKHSRHYHNRHQHIPSATTVPESISRSISTYATKHDTPSLRQRNKRSNQNQKQQQQEQELSEDISVDGQPIHRLSAQRNVVLNTRNPFVIWLAKNESQLSLAILGLIHGCYWAGFEWPALWFRMQHKSPTADSNNSSSSGGIGMSDIIGNTGNVDKYVRGIHDIKFVLYWIVQIIAIRSVLLHRVLPNIPRVLGITITSSRKLRRFCEMGWSAIYITISWTIGYRVWAASPYFMNTNNLYANYPEDHVIMPYGLKWFYLVQTAFWHSNIYTIHIEERRKDYIEMLTHHVVTIALVLLSYAFHFTRFGHAFMLVMDFPDIFLSSAKMFRYLGYETIPNILFGVFSISWVITKHVLCLHMMFSIWLKGPALIPHERHYPSYPNSYASYPIAGILWAILCVLQLILLYWFGLILKVLQRVLIKGEHADDNRSDAEDNADDDESTVVDDDSSSGLDTSSNCSSSS